MHRNKTLARLQPYSITSSARASSIGGTVMPSILAVCGVDHQLEPGGLHDRQVRGFSALEDAAGINADLAVCVCDVASVGHQPAYLGVLTPRICCGQSVTHCQKGQLEAPAVEKGVLADKDGVGPLAHKGREGRIDLVAGAGVEDL